MDEIVTVASFRQPEEAHLAVALLEAQGIESYVANSTIGNLYTLNTGSGNCQLKVLESDYERAREILEASGSLGLEEECEYESETAYLTCPRCGSDDFEELPEPGESILKKIIFSILTVGLYLLARETRLRCRKCGFILP